MSRSTRPVLGALVVALALAVPAAAGQAVSNADVQRLQDLVNDAGSDIATLRRTDPTAARRAQTDLDEIQDDVIYLKVGVRKGQPVSRTDYTDVEKRLESLRTRIHGGTAPAGDSTVSPGLSLPPAPADGASTPSTPQASSAPTTPAKGVVPVGTELDVRLQSALNSGTTKVEDRFEATTLVDLATDSGVLIPAGSVVRGVVTDVKSAGRVERKGSLTLSFDEITVRGRTHQIRGTVTQAVESGGYKQDAGKIGTGAVVGGILGAILGGGKGALAGVLIGGGGVVAATEGQEVELTPGTVVRMRFDSELNLK